MEASMLKNLRPPKEYNIRAFAWEGFFKDDKKRRFIIVYWNRDGDIEVDIFGKGDRIPHASTMVEINQSLLAYTRREEYAKKLNREIRKNFLQNRDIENADTLPTIPFGDRIFGIETRAVALELIRHQTVQLIPTIVADFEEKIADLNTHVKLQNETIAQLELRLAQLEARS